MQRLNTKKRGFTQHQFQNNILGSKFKKNKSGFESGAVGLSSTSSGAGFSILEIAVVSGVIALLTLVSLPLILNYNKATKLRNEVRILATDLKLTQQMAMTKQNIYQVKIYPDTNIYQVINSSDNSIYKEKEIDDEITINTITGFTDNTIQFTPTGGVIEVGTIALINTRNQTSTLQIKPSGYVEIIDE